MKLIWVCWLIGFSGLLVACQAVPAEQAFHHDALCTLRPITVSPQVRTYLRQPLLPGQDMPAGYDVFVRDLAAHNAKMATHCGQ